jgi:hypothetical protein
MRLYGMGVREGGNEIFFLKAEGSVNCSNGRYLATEVGGDRANLN